MRLVLGAGSVLATQVPHSAREQMQVPIAAKSERSCSMPRYHIFKAVGSTGSFAEESVVAESLGGMTQRDDLRNLAIVAHVGEQKRGIRGVWSVA